MSIIARSSELKTPLARLSYPNLLKAQKQETEDRGVVEKYNASLLFPKSTDISGLHRIALEAAEEAWPNKAQQWIKDGVIKSPFLDGDGPQGIAKKTGERKEGHAGHMFIRVGTEQRPKLVNRKLLPVTDPEEITPGSQVYAVINALAWEHPKSGKGLSFGFSMIQVVKVATGDERLGGGGGGEPADYFEQIADESDAPEATKGGAGAAGLFG